MLLAPFSQNNRISNFVLAYVGTYWSILNDIPEPHIEGQSSQAQYFRFQEYLQSRSLYEVVAWYPFVLGARAQHRAFIGWKQSLTSDWERLDDFDISCAYTSSGTIWYRLFIEKNSEKIINYRKIQKNIKEMGKAGTATLNRSSVKWENYEYNILRISKETPLKIDIIQSCWEMIIW